MKKSIPLFLSFALLLLVHSQASSMTKAVQPFQSAISHAQVPVRAQASGHALIRNLIKPGKALKRYGKAGNDGEPASKLAKLTLWLFFGSLVFSLLVNLTMLTFFSFLSGLTFLASLVLAIIVLFSEPNKRSRAIALAVLIVDGVLLILGVALIIAILLAFA